MSEFFVSGMQRLETFVPKNHFVRKVVPFPRSGYILIKGIITRKWFPLQGELAPITKKCGIFLLIITDSFLAGYWYSPGHVCWRSLRR